MVCLLQEFTNDGPRIIQKFTNSKTFRKKSLK